MTDIINKNMKNAIYGILGYIFPIALLIFSTPYVVYKLGVEQYGVWAFVIAIVGTFGVINFGLGDATIKFVSQYHAQKDKIAVSQVANTTFSIYLISATVGCLLLCLFGPEIASRFKSNTLFQPVIFYIAGLMFFVNTLMSVFSAIAKALERFDLLNIINIVMYAAEIFISVLILAFDGTLNQMLVGILTVYTIRSIIFFFLTRHLLPYLKWRIDFSRFREVFSYGFYSMVELIGSIAQSQMDKILIAFYCPISMLAYYQVPMQIANKIQGLLASASNSLFPLTSSLSAQQGQEKMCQVFFFVGRMIIGILLIGFIPSYLLAYELIDLWMGPSFALKSFEIFRIQLIAISLMSMGIVGYYTLKGIGKNNYIAYVSIISGVFVLICNLLMLPTFGIIGAAYAKLMNIFLIGFNFIALFYLKPTQKAKTKFLLSTVLFVLFFMTHLGFSHLILFKTSPIATIALFTIISISTLLVLTFIDYYLYANTHNAYTIVKQYFFKKKSNVTNKKFEKGPNEY
ncbi:MAG: oligosaccharide flippase family protein [Desulfobacteraceae bacterium]|nr:oligosaccharide flippase family protein [Desulfobacteraceae bacterium]